MNGFLGPLPVLVLGKMCAGEKFSQALPASVRYHTAQCSCGYLHENVMIFQLLVLLQMPPPAPMPPFYVNIHAISYTVIFDVDNEVRHSINQKG